MRSQRAEDRHLFAILTVTAVSGSLIMRFFGFDLPSCRSRAAWTSHTRTSRCWKQTLHHEEAQHATAKPDVGFSPMASSSRGPAQSAWSSRCTPNHGHRFHVWHRPGNRGNSGHHRALLLRYGAPWIDKLGHHRRDVRIMGFL